MTDRATALAENEARLAACIGTNLNNDGITLYEAMAALFLAQALGYDLSLGAGLAKLAGRVFRIGHLGSFNDLMLMGTLCGVEMGLSLAGVPHNKGGAQAAMDYLSVPPAAASH